MTTMAELLTVEDMNRLFAHVHTGMAILSAAGDVISCNPAFEALQKRCGFEITWRTTLPDAERDAVAVRLQEGTLFQWLWQFSPKGEAEDVLFNCMMIPISNGRGMFVIESIESELTVQEVIVKLNRQVKLFRIESEFTKKLAHNKQVEMEAVMAQAREVAHVDPLTFLLNRRSIVKSLQDEVLRAERYRSSLSVSIVDVDHFKRINDTYGHSMGDEVLRHVAYLLRDQVRHPDVVGRYGGEEFLIILPNANQHAATEQAERLCRTMREAVIDLKEVQVKVTLSIGTAQWRFGEDTWDSLLNRADNAMYLAKNQGRDAWAVAD